MQNSLLWVYEGQTRYWGWVLTARSGLGSADHTRERLAKNAANFEARRGRVWRNLQDTTNDAIMAARGRSHEWSDWQRSSGDHDGESLLIWLDADTLIRQMRGGTKSLDDFARAYFGVQEGETGPLPYRFEDLVAALNSVQPHDSAAFLRQRLDSNAAGAPLGGLQRAGWALAWSETETESSKREGNRFRSLRIDYRGGLRYPKLGRLPDTEDRLAGVLGKR